MQAYLDWFPGDRVIQGARNLLADRLLDIYQRAHSPGWRWFETSLSYSNARLSQALLLAGYESNNLKDGGGRLRISQVAACRTASRG